MCARVSLCCPVWVDTFPRPVPPSKEPYQMFDKLTGTICGQGESCRVQTHINTHRRTLAQLKMHTLPQS